MYINSFKNVFLIKLSRSHLLSESSLMQAFTSSSYAPLTAVFNTKHLTG